jgi:O-antigen/teichoic acid export membrane protein
MAIGAADVPALCVHPMANPTSFLSMRPKFEFRRPRMPVRGSMLHKFVGVLSVDVVLRASSVIFLPIYLWLMTPDAFASFSYIMALVGVLSLVCNFGLYVAQSKLLHEFSGQERTDAVFTINVLLAVMLSSLLFPLYAFGWDRVFLRFFFSGNVSYDQYRFLVPVGVVLTVYSQLLINFYLNCGEIARLQRYNISRLAFGLLLTMGSLYAIHGDGAVIRMLAYCSAEFAVLAVFIPNYLLAMRGRFNREVGRRSLSLSLPIMGSGLLGLMINFSDKFFLERYSSLPEMSVYFFGLTLSSAITLVATSFQSVWLPSFLSEPILAVNLARTRRAAYHLLLSLTLLAVAVWSGVALALYLGAFKREYAAVLGILPILLASSIAIAATGLLSNYTVYWNKTYVNVYVGSVVAAVSVPTNFYAVAHWGIYGAASTYLLVNVLFLVIYAWFVTRQVRAHRTTALDRHLPT